MTDGYADDNNRVGIYFFGDTPEVPSQDEAGAIGLIFNTDDGSAGGPPGTDTPTMTSRFGWALTALPSPPTSCATRHRSLCPGSVRHRDHAGSGNHLRSRRGHERPHRDRRLPDRGRP